jgi:hypothetical protein
MPDERPIQGRFSRHAYIRMHQRRRCHPGIGSPLETSMLILLVITAVAVSLAGEFLYAYIAELRDGTWVRSDVKEHHEIVRVMGRVSFKPIREVE